MFQFFPCTVLATSKQNFHRDFWGSGRDGLILLYFEINAAFMYKT